MRILPKSFKRSNVYKKLYVFQKAFLLREKTSKIHYGQFAEDVAVSKLFPKLNNGFFVDVGCFHPLKYSNTWILYKRGWRGINIDIDQVKIDVFDLKRPEDTNIACGISNTEGEVDCYTDGEYSLTTTFDKKFASRNSKYTMQKKYSRKLTNVIDSTKYKARQIDFLNIDAEGHDFEVLSSLDLTIYKPKIVAIESHSRWFSEVENTDSYKYLTERGYELVGWHGLTLLLASSEFEFDNQ